ncbi:MULTISPECIES: hypothetical protein [unclassified Neisseria]|nr:MULTISPECIES: hypothetical protein [unclassified Neisseria]MBF0802976.1 hypothetical protein [Neisseria sp. 19428wB4_WF04]
MDFSLVMWMAGRFFLLIQAFSLQPIGHQIGQSGIVFLPIKKGAEVD